MMEITSGTVTHTDSMVKILGFTEFDPSWGGGEGEKVRAENHGFFITP
jgi:hypothetical protein